VRVRISLQVRLPILRRLALPQRRDRHLLRWTRGFRERKDVSHESGSGGCSVRRLGGGSRRSL
jgi:hypothetical protein